MTPSDRTDDPSDPLGTDPERLFAELEGATEGPGGRGRDQEVISQTERASSRVAAPDHSVALAELRAFTENLIAERRDLVVVSNVETPVRAHALQLRCLGNERSLLLVFDPANAAVSVHRGGNMHARIEPYDERSPDAPRRSIEAELVWLCSE